MPVTVTPSLPPPGQTPAVAYEAGTVLKATALTTFVVLASDMAGIEFTIGRLSGASTTHTWVDLGSPAGGLTSHPDFVIGMSGDTFLPSWFFSNLAPDPVVTIAINGAPGRITFDANIGPKAANSADGWPFSPEIGYPDALARYSHKVRVGGALNEDQYACLAIRFPTPVAQFGEFYFRADTDKLAEGIDFELDAPPPPAPAPSPAPSYTGTARPFISRNVMNAPGIQLQPLGREAPPPRVR